MKTVWTKGLSPEQKKEMQDVFNASGRLRNRLSEIVQDKIASKNTERVSSTTYDNPNWALVQADAIGYERALKEIISIIS